MSETHAPVKPGLVRQPLDFAALENFDTIIDTRSPAEYALDHIPGAVNCPVLDDQEREQVGTLYQQTSALTPKNSVPPGSRATLPGTSRTDFKHSQKTGGRWCIAGAAARARRP